MTLQSFIYKTRTFFGFNSLNATDLKNLMLGKRYAKSDPIVKEVICHMVTKNISKIEKFLSKGEKKTLYLYYTSGLPSKQV